MNKTSDYCNMQFILLTNLNHVHFLELYYTISGQIN